MNGVRAVDTVRLDDDPDIDLTVEMFAHDIATLLGVIANCATVLSRHVTDPSDSTAVADIVAAVDLASGLTRRLARGDREPSVDPGEDLPSRAAGTVGTVDVVEVVRDTAAALRGILGDRVALDLDLPDRCVPAACDRAEFERLLLNLAANSREAMPQGGVFGITLCDAAETTTDASAAGDHVVLAVTDTGLGMAQEVAGRAFDPYFTTKGDDGGSGLGLAIVRDIAQRNGGDVLLDSVPRQGTRVVVRLASTHVTLEPVVGRSDRDDGRAGP